MILTVTLNTALDITYRVPGLRPHASHRVTEVTERPGGKGLNVARVLAALGHPVTVTGFAGGSTGATVRASLAGVPGVVDALVPVAGATRRTVAVVDERTGDTTQLNEPGPVVAPAEWNAFQEAYEGLLAGAAAVALCGSLPPGVPVGAYAGLVRTARAAGVPVLLDTSGEPLRRGVAARPDLIKPNADELAELTGSHEPLRATQAARRRGARSVVASLGAAGLLAETPEGRWRAAPPAQVRGNPTGAGDSAVAGLLSGLVEHLPWPDRLARAVALSAATVLSPVAGEFDRAAYEELLGRGVAVTAEADAA
ncbi:1-phosphofructokinase family hexose kinase [Streptomyces rochei]|uniref:1-phosphofructokinase family hexose kinase n=2 Tax=Streptomyces rochei group TaxID=2867164 RepID=A0ABY6BUK7_9ACTN|nr:MULTISPECIES: 1-phosphofructokinase family hexose kinase [Streptomyces]GGY64276.1 sugar kinase [Streptomyces geysiriensis]MBJ6620150.1 1-phosphofructokinase family hexose kinase [Streptomyces sp. DHE17-7]MBU8550409.1 1-phosphofructokinase family hexose kinase [Streptomyces sp. Osf17]MBU8557186.1 1-phosphofructokinase family hexose kinase [Streptomyces sp. Babs14]MCC8451372.1 1-phosphofructokinase family hexose kinase [Streptomyces rochei]